MHGIRFLKGAATTLMVTGLTLGVYSSAQAMRSYRIGMGLNNQNPAELSGVKQYEVDIEGVWRDAYLNQNNFTINGIPGSVPSWHSVVLPYFRVAYRLNPKWVVGVDYSHPWWTEIGYGISSFVSALSDNTRVHSFQITPHASYQVNSYLSLGVGFDTFEITDALLSFQIPGGGPIYSAIQNAQATGFGFDAGFFLTIRKGTTLSFAGFSPIAVDFKGLSRFGNTTRYDAWLRDNIPTTFVLRLTQAMTSKWTLRLIGAWDEQAGAGRYGQFVFYNTARGTLISPLRNNNSFILALMNNYQINNRWGFLLGGLYEDGSQPTLTNRVSFPVGDGWGVVAGPSVKFNKIASMQVTYSYAWTASKFSFRSATAGPVIGDNRAHANIVDVKLVFKA